MGLINNIRGLFSGSKNTQTPQVQKNAEYEKARLADKTVDLVNKIKKINSFDRSIWNYSNASSYEFKRKSLEELQNIYASLEKRLAELTTESQKSNPSRESLEAAKWTGQKPKDMSSHDFDRFQR